METKPAKELLDSIEYDSSLFPKVSIDPYWQHCFDNWKPYNEVGKRIDTAGRVGTIIKVSRPVYMDEVERITVKFDDDNIEEEFPIRGIRIGSDWMR